MSEPISIPGVPPDPVAMPEGCRFARRCPFALDICTLAEPPLTPVASGHRAARHRAAEMPRLRQQAEAYETWAATAAARAQAGGIEP